MGIEEKRLHLKCKSCYGTMDVSEDREILLCPYCGSKELIIQSDRVKIQKIKSQVYKEVEHERQEKYKAVEFGKQAYEMDMRKLEI